jgi:hypothetical protein
MGDCESLCDQCRITSMASPPLIAVMSTENLIEMYNFWTEHEN